jgi:hypothetical protein
MKTILLATAAVLLLLAWLSTGGIVVCDYWIYREELVVHVEEGKALRLSIDTHIKHNGLRFVFLTVRDHPPYSLRLHAHDYDTSSFEELLVDELTLEASDGAIKRIVTPEQGWRKKFEPKVSYNSTSRGVVEKRRLAIEHGFGGVIPGPQDVSIRLSARIVTKENTVIRVNETKKIKPSREKEVISGLTDISRS